MNASLAELVDLIAGRLDTSPPHVVAIGGAVAVGKSTVAQALAAGFRERDRRPVVVATDAFLLSNAKLTRRDALYRKGFPETYDWTAMEFFLEKVRAGVGAADIPVYSHAIYDIVAGESERIANFDLVLFEGVVALQPRIAHLLDATVYVDADEADVKRWFSDRFVRLTDEARAGAESFYRMFAAMTPDDVRTTAEGTWDAINGPNLHEHISKTRDGATFVVRKRADHSIEAVAT